jgi:hypothetical protein
MLSTSLLWGRFWCNPTWSSDCDNRANVSCSSLGFLAWPLAILENSSGRYAELIRLCIPYNQVASLDVVPDCMPRPPAIRVKCHEKFYICSDVTHTHLAYSEVYFWKSFAGEIGNKPVRMNLSGANVQNVLISLRREILFHLKYLDRVVEAHAINHRPSFIDFPRCRSSRQSVWKLFG